MNPVSAAEAPGGRTGYWLGIIDGRRLTVVVEGRVADVDCCWIWWGETVGAVYTGVWFEALPAVDCPCIRERSAVVFTAAAAVGVGRPNCGVKVCQVFGLGPGKDGA